jgi:general secretion pathway protein A
MYEEYFGLKKKPFSIVPDPGYFYMSSGHREALAHLLYGINSDGGFVLLTGEVGAGKTTVARRLLQLMPEEAEVAFILNPKLTPEELLATICDELGIAYPEGTASIKVLVARISDYLLRIHREGRRAVLIIEEAQNLNPEALEQIRLLTNLETHSHKLLQVIMLGQPELRQILSRPELRQLSQRISARYHLGPLARGEVPLYVSHRLAVAGLVRGQPFPPPTLKRLFRLSRGIPRLINAICDRALLGAYVGGKEVVDIKILRRAAREVRGEERRWGDRGRIYRVAAASFLFLLGLAVGALYYGAGSVPWPLPAGSRVHAPDPTEAVREAEGTALARPAESAGKVQVRPRAEATLDKPGDLRGGGTRQMAYQALFQAWHIAYDPEDQREACDQARAQGLRCLTGKGTIGALREMNRPAMLRLIDGKGGEYYATLTALEGETAVFAIGRETRTVGIGEVAERWSGSFVLLWRPPSGYTGNLKPGSRGPAVAWLERQLARAQGQPIPSGGDGVYDLRIMKRVRQFQTAIGVTPDGIAGLTTIMRLAGTGTDNRDPLLRTEKGIY